MRASSSPSINKTLATTHPTTAPSPCLLSVMGKLFESMVNSRLLNFSESVGSVSDEQGGFRPIPKGGSRRTR